MAENNKELSKLKSEIIDCEYYQTYFDKIEIKPSNAELIDQKPLLPIWLRGE